MPRKLMLLLLFNVLAFIEIILAWVGPQNVNQPNSLSAWFFPGGILLILFAPGYSLIAGFIPVVKKEDMFILSIALSIVIDIVGGLMLNLTPWGLKPLPWVILLAGVVFFGSLNSLKYNKALSVNNYGIKIDTIRVNWRNLVMITISLAILIIAIQTTLMSVKQVDYYTELWAIPSVEVGSYALNIGIYSREKKLREYDLYLEQDKVKLNEISGIKVEPGQTWTTIIPLDTIPNSRVNIYLYDSQNLTDAYRTVQISPLSFDFLMSPIPTSVFP